MSKEKYSFTTCDFVTAYVTFITNNSISAHLIGKSKAIELKTVNYDFTTDLTTFTLEIKRNRGKR